MTLCPALSQKHLRKKLGAFYIVLFKPSLNNQSSFDTLMLFRNVITCFLIEMMISCTEG